MAPVVSISSRCGLVIEPSKTQLSHYFYRKGHIKQLYITNKMECFSYKGGYGISIARYLKEKLAWAIDKRLCIILLLKVVILLRNHKIKLFKL